MNDILEFSPRISALIGAGGTVGTWTLQNLNEFAALSVAVVTICVLIPTGISAWRKILIRSEMKSTQTIKDEINEENN